VHLVILFDCGDITEQYGTDFVLFEVLGHAINGLTTGCIEFEELALHGVLQTVDARNAVAHRDNGADFACLDIGRQRIQLLAQRLIDCLGGDFSHLHSPPYSW